MSLSAGTKLGPYEISATLGAGGMGEVYRAVDTRLGRIVAVKMLKGGHNERFQTEARAIAALNHPHICTLYDVGPDYLVMEYIEGKPARGPIAPEEVVRLAGQIAAALAEAHAKGIAHRDLKPDNILLTASGVKLLDFGLAKVMQAQGVNEDTQELGITQPHTILGTAFYMSPEQAQGQTVDARSDIFSLGAVLYEMLTGERAFDGESQVTVLAAILHQEPRIGREIPTGLGRILARCMRKQPGERFQTMGELREALDKLGAKPAVEESPSIAVLPFANMSSDKENEYFGDGLAEEILNELTKLAGLKVIARTSSFAFKGRNEDVRRIGETLGVAHILEGSVRRAGNRIRITAQLIKVSDGAHAWSDRYDRELNDIFAVQDEIALAIAEVLHCKLIGKCRSGRPEPSIEAYQAFLEGQSLMFHSSPAAMARKMQCLERAIELEPDYAPPYAGLAMHHGQLALFFGGRPRDEVPKAMKYLERALELDANNGMANCLSGMLEGVFHYNWQGALQLVEKAIATNPSYAFAHLALAWCQHPMGKVAEAQAAVEKAIALDPLSLPARHTEADLWAELGRPEKVRERVQIFMEMAPGQISSCGYGGNALADCGCWDEAIELFEQGLRIAPLNAWLLSSLASALDRRGQRVQATRILKDLEALAQRQYVSPVVFARVHASQGDVEKTYAALDRAVEERDPMLIQLLHAPVLKKLPAADRYQALMRTVNLGGTA